MQMSVNVESKKSPFAGNYFDGVFEGFVARVNVTDYDKENVCINLQSNFETPKKWTVVVRAEKAQQNPNIGCLNFSQTSEWKFVLATTIDPTTLSCEYADDSLILRAKHQKPTEDEAKTGTKRKAINTEFSDQRAPKRFRALKMDQIDGSLDNDSKSSENDEFHIMNELPIELLNKIIRSLETRSEILKCSLVCKRWRNAVSLIPLPKTLRIDANFLQPAKYLNFIETFRHHEKLPFTGINYTYGKKPNVSQLYVLDFIQERGSGIEDISVVLRFETNRGRQTCPLLEWISQFKRCSYLKVRIAEHNPRIPIDYGNVDLSHVKDFEMGALMFKKMQAALKNRFPLNECENKVMHSYYERMRV